MRIARYGIGEFLLITITLISVSVTMVLCGLHYAFLAIPVGFWLFFLNFFRDPDRVPSRSEGTVISPADGAVTDITDMTESEYIQGEAVRFGIFMNVFSVHVNRSPVSGTVEYVKHHPGKFLDVRYPGAIAGNEHVTIGIACDDPFYTKIVVKQVAGKVARRIVFEPSIGDRVEKGQRIGMIKLGSRLEVFIPKGVAFTSLVKVGDSVAAGRDPLLAADEKS